MSSRKEQGLVDVLEEIRRMAMEHPAFDADSFKERNIKSLAEQGGEVCDWTMIAILADDALEKRINK